MSELAQLVQRRLVELGEPGQPLTLRTAARKARDAVSYETLRLIARGEHSGKINDKTARGIAAAIDVSVQAVYDAARVPRPQSRWTWPERFDRLDAAQRRVVEDVAAGFLEAYEKGLRDG